MRHISCVENIDNLRALIKQDLREFGIKIPKGKKLKKQAQYTKNQQSQQENTESIGVFENVLAQVACVHIPNCGYVPRFLVDAADIIVKNIHQEGLFRKSGAVSRIKDLKEKIENGQNLGNANIVDVTVLIKQFFKCLPEPLFTSTYHDAFVRCIQLPDKEEAKHAVLLLCLLLPGEHLSTIKYMMNLLKNIAKNSDKNKMDATNLSVVLAPNFLYLNSKSEKMNSVEEKLLQFQTLVVEVLIRNAEDIGFVSDSLYERTLLMTECFGTDDELDASSEALEESRDCKKKEKKRKRSGSFTGKGNRTFSLHKKGIVNTIAQSITKWRRSTDGKTGNVSNLSQASNISDISTKCNKSTVINEVSVDLTAATPVVMRKRKASEDVVAFSTSKKKAILQNLPQGSALGSTPFTPGTGLRNLDLKKGNRDTPSIAFSNRGQVAFNATPCANGKGTRKRLNLFSPGSMRKSKKNASGSNISAQDLTKKIKPGGKGLFRRLSGGKGDKSQSELNQSEQTQQVGLRLASPTCTPKSSEDSDEQIEQGSPLPVILNQSNSSVAAVEQSMVSVCDDRNSLNEGFINYEDLDISEMSHVQRDEPRHCLSDTAIMYGNDSTYNNSLSRSMSLEAQKNRLRRGQPNSVKTGLLHGERENVQKLRRSFGLDKSEIGEPVALFIPDLPQIQNAKDILSNTETLNHRHANIDKNHQESHRMEYTSQCKTSKIESVSVSKQLEQQKSTNYISVESEAGFSTVSGNTVIFVQENGAPKSADEKIQIHNKCTENDNETKRFQSSTSTDSLLSGQENVFVNEEKKTIARSLSQDSGKGSMLDLSGENENVAINSPGSISQNKVNVDETTNNGSNSALNLNRAGDEGNVANITSGSEGQNEMNKDLNTEKRYNSAHDLKQTFSKSVSRSQSLCEPPRKSTPNITPNLQISSDTHKLLSRAGYLASKSTAAASEDVVVMGPPPPKIKQVEVVIPKHESIMELQTKQRGRVATTARHFDCDVSERHSSPYRFPNSTRKRGMSPIRIPTIFTKSNEEAVKMKELVTVNQKLGKGQAKLPISTQLLKPTEDVTTINSSCSAAAPHGTKLKRKPSIYYTADHNRLNESSILLEKVSEEESMEVDISDPVIQSDKENKTKRQSFYDEDQLNESLQATVNDICTPMSEKIDKDYLEDKESENITPSSTPKIPTIKMPLSTPLTEMVVLRTAAGMTPRQVIKRSRSPVKPVKRLRSPGSPCRNSQRKHSPSRANKHRLSSIPCHLQEEMSPL